MRQCVLLSKYWLIGCLIFFFCGATGFSQTGTLVTSIEAESGVLSGGVTKGTSITGYSGTGYVTNFKNSADKVTMIVTIPTTAFYSIFIRYRSADNKYQNLIVNKSGASSVYFPKSTGWTNADGGKYFLHAGTDTLTIQSSWGWTEIDKLMVYTTALNTYNNITLDLVDTKASTATKSLYAFLLSQFGKKFISGQTDGYYTNIKTLTGKSPLYRVWDFQHYTEGYAYLWKDGGHTFGVDPGAKDSENAIEWYNSTGKKGIVGFQWHWHSPSGGNAGKNTFYTSETTFDIRKAVQVGTPEYALIIRDIDAIAAQLKKFQTANVPVLFRPLHEAGGAWFWWGAKGSTPCKQLYAIIYDRIKNYHQIHNLIWVWSTPETDWYPGNSTVDIVGHDSYPGDYNYGTQKNMFDKYYQLTNGEKIVTMSENGPIPDPDACLDFDSPWSFFMSWSDLVLKQNSEAHLKAVFTNPKVLTLENDTIPMIVSATNDLCISGTATLEATANFGSVNWYDQATGGSIIQTGTKLSIPALTETTNYYVEASYNGRPSQLKRNVVTVNPIPKTPVVNSNNAILQSNGSFGNQWFFNNTLIPDAVGNSYTPAKSGNYHAVVTINGCLSQASNAISFIMTDVEDVAGNKKVSVYPNPMERGIRRVTISGIKSDENAAINIFDIKGSLVFSGFAIRQKIDLENRLDTGIYIINILSNGVNYTEKLIVK